MRFTATAATDVGISKAANQDSVLVKHGSTQMGEILMAIVCDGMGGLSKGELASATVIRAFARWFDAELPYELENLDMQVIGGKWAYMLKDLNIKIMEYGQTHGTSLGTTFTGVLFVGDRYVIAHVGDTRLYYMGPQITQLTQDQTFVAREVGKGTMTLEQAKVDRRRNLLLQCVGASKTVEPDILCGVVQKGAYLICSDGFRHEISDAEMFQVLSPGNLTGVKAMHEKLRGLIGQVKARKEKDNISAVLIKVE